MVAKFRSALASINASYWFYPALFSVLAVVAATFTLYLDRNGAAEWFRDSPLLHVSRPNGARTTLSVIAGSMIGVASTVFSITIAAVAYASGNYGPRLLTNFMEDKGNQLSLATFIGTFVYALVVIRAVRDESEQAATIEGMTASVLPGFTPQLSLTVAMGLALLSVMVLVFFLHHIPASIRINQVLEGIGERLLRDIKERFPVDTGDAEPKRPRGGTPVIAPIAGYVQLIDFGSLGRLAKKEGGQIALKVRTGDFVAPDLAIAELIDIDPSGAVVEQVRAGFDLGGMRTPTQDLEFLFDELVEIALRALSPGINDPFTAITALHWLSAAMGELGRRDLDRGPEQDRYDPNHLIPLDDDFDHFLRRGIGGVRTAAAANALASRKFLDGLWGAATACRSARRRGLLEREGALLLAQARTVLEGPALAELEERYEKFGATMAALGDKGERG